MINKDRKVALGLALVTTLVMFISLACPAVAGAAATVGVNGMVIDQNEAAIDGTRRPLTVKAVSAAGDSLEVVVGANGTFSFGGLAEGQWNFTLQLPPDWEALAPTAPRGGLAQTGMTNVVGGNEPAGGYTIVFKIRRLIDITVIKWEELLNGTVQPGAGWTIWVKPLAGNGAPGQSNVTGANGQVTFTVTPGAWSVTEFPLTRMSAPAAGWVPVWPLNGTVNLTLDDYSPTPPQIVLKNQQPPCTAAIEVHKFGYGTDAQGGQVLLGALAGWTGNVTSAAPGAAPIPWVTDFTGVAAVTGLKPGVYTVSENVEPGWTSLGPNPLSVTLTDCETAVVTFKNKELIGVLQISGRKTFVPPNGPLAGRTMGLAGWSITAKLVGTDVMTTTVTDAFGNYIFTQEGLAAAGMAIPGATIEVSETPEPGWNPVTPASVLVTFPYPVPGTYAGEVVNFRNRQATDPVMADPPPADPPDPPADQCRLHYIVRWGDSVSRIAAHHGVTMRALARANHMSIWSTILPGQELCIP